MTFYNLRGYNTFGWRGYDDGSGYFLLLLLTKFGFCKIEVIVVTLITTIYVNFIYLVALSKPSIVGLVERIVH